MLTVVIVESRFCHNNHHERLVTGQAWQFNTTVVPVYRCA